MAAALLLAAALFAAGPAPRPAAAAPAEWRVKANMTADCAFEDLPGLPIPQLCWNALPDPPRFPNSTRAYATLCAHDALDVRGPGRRCLLVAASVLHTRPAHGFVLMVPANATLSAAYAAALEALNVETFRFAALPVPEAARACHAAQGNGRWVPAYQKLNAWRAPKERLLYLDADSLVIDNIDDSLSLADGMGCANPYDPAHMLRHCIPSGSVVLLTPSNATAARLAAALAKGAAPGAGCAIAGHRQCPEACRGWRWPVGDQQLIKRTLGLPVTLSPQLRVDMKMCYGKPSAGAGDFVAAFPQYFHPRRWAAIHAWGHAQRDAPLATPEGRCRRLVSHVLDFYDGLVSQLVEGTGAPARK